MDHGRNICFPKLALECMGKLITDINGKASVLLKHLQSHENTEVLEVKVLKSRTIDDIFAAEVEVFKMLDHIVIKKADASDAIRRMTLRRVQRSWHLVIW